ncbi:MAG TPA: hypothetical protein VK674_06725 [Candidatus Limnocylindria bacterium]|nr:hypothetical protein [Candidatus Limnocylindria bacterium]
MVGKDKSTAFLPSDGYVSWSACCLTGAFQVQYAGLKPIYQTKQLVAVWEIERRWLDWIDTFAEQTCFVGKLAIQSLHIDEGR